MEKELEKIKENLLNEYWTENFHEGLKELGDEKAKVIVESMNSQDIYGKVNFKSRQQDYIADYLKYLWDISENSFWKHIEMLFQDDEELLMSDNMFYHEKLCNEKIPPNILQEVVNYIRYYNSDDVDRYEYEYELLTDIILMQVRNYQRLDEINNIISSYPVDVQRDMNKKITQILASETTFL